MGSAISKGANGIGNVIGDAFSAPFKTIFGGSCEDICSGPWDVTCFIEHLCFSSLVKLLMILTLCYICLLFLYLLLKVGICQCIGRKICKMRWPWVGFEEMSCCWWHKLVNTKRVYRGRRRRIQDVEHGCYRYNSEVGRKRKSLRLRETRNEPSRKGYHHHFARSRLKGRRRSTWSWRFRSSRRATLGNTRTNRHGKATIFKRRPLK